MRGPSARAVSLALAQGGALHVAAGAGAEAGLGEKRPQGGPHLREEEGAPASRVDQARQRARQRPRRPRSDDVDSGG
jgi:hypothetical protein